MELVLHPFGGPSVRPYHVLRIVVPSSGGVNFRFDSLCFILMGKVVWLVPYERFVVSEQDDLDHLFYWLLTRSIAFSTYVASYSRYKYKYS